MTKATELDAQIALNLKKLRAQSKLSQPQVAAHLGITYQSYQKMESGKHSFRVSTLNRLSLLYGCPVNTFVQEGGSILDPLSIKAIILMRGMSEADRESCIRAIIHVRHKEDQ